MAIEPRHNNDDSCCKLKREESFKFLITPNLAKHFNNSSYIVGPRLEQTRPMDKQSVRSYPGDRDSVRSVRRSRREDSSSGYSDNERRYRRSVCTLNRRQSMFFVSILYN